MAIAETLPTTQRAYTLRLRGIDENDCSWRDALWATHEAVNKGAKVFGDWLLTLRGGLSHELANQKVVEGKGKKKNERDPTDAERRDRRILLALSWLSVEDEHGAPQDESMIVARGTDSADCRARKLGDALTDILKARGVEDSELGDPDKRPEDQPGTWLDHCMPSLSAAIRDDAVWVNRSAAFDAAVQQCPSLTRDEIWDFLEPFFVNTVSYLRSAQTTLEEESTVRASDTEDKAKDLVQKAGGWLSSRMGTGGGADFERMSRAYDAITAWTETAAVGNPGEKTLASLACHLKQEGFAPSAEDVAGVLSVISGPGYKSATRNHVTAINALPTVSRDDLTKLAELAQTDAQASKSKIGGKGSRPYANMILQQVECACGFTYRTDEFGKDVSVADYAQYSDDYKWGTARHTEFSVMLDHAARRVNVAHSWIKNAEAERRQFENDANRLQNVPQSALQWLRKYCEDRAGTAGSLDVYRIRKRAIDGWDTVVNRWSRADCRSPDDRIAAARQLQDDPEIGKFGDIQLFEALAAEDALCVWKPDGNPTAQPLKDFVAATEAEAKKKRFKVPAYRHPDPLRHPVFTDFGNSRWGIDFSAHRAPAKLGEFQQKVQKLAAALAEAERKLSSATESQREARQRKVTECRDKLRKAERDLETIRDHQRVELKVWNGQAVVPKPFSWSCKRLVRDLALSSTSVASSEPRTGVTRADRLGRAAVGADGSSEVTITGLFQQDHWNGRLQAPRAQLDAIARHVEKHGWDAKARTLVERLRWLMTFSAELTQLGPWKEYCDRFRDDAPAKPFISRKGEYAVKHRDNDQRKGHAKLILSRLPGLRVLAVDLGHRFAAACAVWEAITQEQMWQVCTDAGISPPDASAMYVHVQGKNTRGRPTTTVYRRIGPDVLPDSTPHPAPWARLDRQFLITLQGEDRPARKASPDEIEAVNRFERWTGRVPSDSDAPRELAVDALMSDTVRTARLALARHGRRARVAHNFIATTLTLPGDRVQPLDSAGRLELLANTLADWHALATDSRWNDTSARQLWNDRLASLSGGFSIAPPIEPMQTDQEQTRAQRRQAEQELHHRLQPLAQTISSNDALQRELHDAWAVRWNTDDEHWREKLKWLSRWLMPRGGTTRDASRRHVGGLSLTRISTLTEFRRKVQIGYFTRLRPDGSRAEIGLGFGQSTLNTIQRLKDQRIKQLASRIVEAALGVGIERRGENGRALPRPRRRSNDPRFAPCHAVIIEDLTHYRPEETRTRRENRATMDWKSAETRTRLADHCQLYGVYLRDVNPQYTSRQDSRTGLPGVRCVDVPVDPTTGQLKAYWWKKSLSRAKKKIGNAGSAAKKGDAESRFIVDLADQLAVLKANGKQLPASVRVPRNGGDLFVAAPPWSCRADGHRSCPLCDGRRVVHADLNAAANIGLRALLDPDFSGRWWYIPAAMDKDGWRVPAPKSCVGAACLDGWKVAHKDGYLSADGTPRAPGDDESVKSAQQIVDFAKEEFDAAKRAAKKAGADQAALNSLKERHEQAKAGLKEAKKAASQKEIVNAWQDPRSQPTALGGGNWLETSAYWNGVRARAVGALRVANGLEMDDPDGSVDDDNIRR